MDRGNWLPPGADNGRSFEMVYIETTGDGWEMNKIMPDEEERMYRAIEKNVPKSFSMVDSMRSSWPNGSYFVLMENDFCEVILSREQGHFAIAFAGKDKSDGKWYGNWRRTAKRVFGELRKEGFEISLWTSDDSLGEFTADVSSTFVAGLRKKYAETGKLHLATEVL